MTTDRSILLAVRIGPASTGPARTAAWLASGLNARVTVLHVAAELETAAAVAAASGLDEDTVRERLHNDAREKARSFVHDVLSPVPYDVVVGKGDVAKEVAAVARRTGADLIVTGPRSRGVTSIILGDTTSEILRRAPCPVVVAPPEE